MTYERKTKYKRVLYAGIAFFAIAIISAILNHSASEKNRIFEDANGEIIVIFTHEIKEENILSYINSINSSIVIKRNIDDYALLSVNKQNDYFRAIKKLQNSSVVKAVQPNHGISTMQVTKDPYSGMQWAVNNPGYYIYQSESRRIQRMSLEGIDMEVLKAWENLGKEKANQEVVVAIIDTGVDYAHPDLADNMWINTKEIPGDGIDNDGNGYIDDIYGWDFYNNDATVCHYQYSYEHNLYLSSPEDDDNHGTHIAGIIGAIANNNIGVAGIASNVKIKLMALKINGGPNGTGTVASAIEAIKYATMMGADIGNLSWGTMEYSEALKQVMRESDMLFVAAAGNSGKDNDSNPVYPANYDLDNLISVTFIDAKGELSKHANYGKVTVDLAAPGDDIVSTIVGKYGYMTGSSMAAPHVTAVAAMLYAQDANLYPANVKDIITSNIKKLPNLDGYVRYPGIPSAYQTVLASGSLIKDIDSPVLDFSMIYNKNEFIIPVTAQDKGGSGIRVIKWIFGERTLADFKRGISGTSLTDSKIVVTKAGKYTFFASDYAGNDVISTFEVLDDVTKPKVSLSYTVANNYKSRTVSVQVSDEHSGLRRVKYMEGKKKAEDFLPAGAGTELTVKNGKTSFKVSKDGTYTVYAIDHRGNFTVKRIQVLTVKATEIKFAKAKYTVTVGQQQTLRTLMKPVDTTDIITYVSSNPKVATVTSKGRITALKEGKTVISARTSSGITAVTEVTVKK